jgi:hypothetical protein
MLMDREQARLYVNRWKAVREVENAELRRMTDAEHYRALVDLFEAARRFPEHPAVRARREKQIEEVRARWTRLKEGI